MADRRSAAFGWVAAATMGLALLDGCESAPSKEDARPLFDVWPWQEASDQQLITTVQGLIEQSDVVIVGTISSVVVGDAVYVTPDPATPQAAYGGQSVVITVTPSDGSAGAHVEFIYNFPAQKPALELTSPLDVILPKGEVMLALIGAPGSDGMFRCAGGSAWCPLVWNGVAFDSPITHQGALPLFASPPGANRPATLREAVASLTMGTDVEVRGLG